MKSRFHWKSFLFGMLAVAVMIALALPVLGASGVWQTWDVLVGGYTLMVYGQTVQPEDANGNPVEIANYNGTTYLPIRTIGKALGKEVDYDADTRTIYLGAKPPQGRYWVFTDMKVIVDDTVYPDTYQYSYVGQKDGKEWMQYLYRWSYGNEYTYADLVFGCDTPPTMIPAGGEITLEVNYRVANFHGEKNDGKRCTAPAGAISISDGFGGYLKGPDGEKSYWPGEPNTNFLTGDMNGTMVFSGPIPDRTKEIGKTICIRFSCSAGQIEWYYTQTEY